MGQPELPASVLLELPPEPIAIQIAREFVTNHCSTFAPELVDDAELLVSELVTNAITHGQPSIVMRVRREPPGIGVEVHDQGDAEPLLPSEDPDDDLPSGRGLRIVAAIASSWGVRPADDGDGKIVWFTLHPAT